MDHVVASAASERPAPTHDRGASRRPRRRLVEVSTYPLHPRQSGGQLRGWHLAEALGQVEPLQLLGLVLVCLVILATMLSLSWWLARRLGFNREDVIAIQFCGTKKSLATGLPMATVLFAGSPVGLLVLPLMVFHQAQLMACGSLAARYARQVYDTD